MRFSFPSGLVAVVTVFLRTPHGRSVPHEARTVGHVPRNADKKCVCAIEQPVLKMSGDYPIAVALAPVSVAGEA
jgi:hypothetical protein